MGLSILLQACLVNPLSENQRRALIALATGVGVGYIHGDTLNGLRRRQLADTSTGQWGLTDKGREEADALLPKTRAEAILRASDDLHDGVSLPAVMTDICCDEFEGAIAQSVIRRSVHTPMTYVGANGRYWSISFCPFCGKPR